jgi:hypothetical protein
MLVDRGAHDTGVTSLNQGYLLTGSSLVELQSSSVALLGGIEMLALDHLKHHRHMLHKRHVRVRLIGVMVALARA